eukprot:5485021-Pyramimonas_sp.AAC.1
MVRYLADRARPINRPRGCCNSPELPATPEEITAMRGLCGKVSWTCPECVPDGSGDVSLLSDALPNSE